MAMERCNGIVGFFLVRNAAFNTAIATQVTQIQHDIYYFGDIPSTRLMEYELLATASEYIDAFSFVFGMQRGVWYWVRC